MRETTQPFPRIAMREARLVSNMRFQSSKGRGRRGKSIYSAHCVNRLARSPRGRIFVGQHRENTEAYERHGNRLSSRPAAWRPPESEAAAVANPPRQNFHLGILILSTSTPERTCAVQLRDVRFVPIADISDVELLKQNDHHAPPGEEPMAKMMKTAERAFA